LLVFQELITIINSFINIINKWYSQLETYTLSVDNVGKYMYFPQILFKNTTFTKR